LLAVPPVLGTPIDTQTLRDIVIETHELALARAARLDDLGPERAIVPLVMLPATGTTGVSLDPARI
jgi:hypothetical protein